MSTSYDVTFNNQTATTWTLVLYITLPAGSGLASVSWKQASVAPNGIGSLSWTDNSYAVLGTAKSFNGVPGFALSQAVSAPPDTGWNIVVQNSVQQLVAAGAPLLKGTIQINNVSSRNANPGFGLDGAGALYKSNLASGLSIQLTPQPQYWAMLAEQMSVGEVITVAGLPSTKLTAAAFTPPQALSFPNGQTSATVTASMSGEALIVAITYP